MKKLFLLFTATVMAMSVMALEPTAIMKGDLKAYDYYYVDHTSGVSENSVVPSDVIRGYLMKNGFNVVASVNPEYADRTLIVTYGYTGQGAMAGEDDAIGVIVQMRNAKTQELVASYEAHGDKDFEDWDVKKALTRVMRTFGYSLDPKVVVEIYNQKCLYNSFEIVNRTTFLLNHVTLKIQYFLDGELVHEQISTIDEKLPSGTWIRKDITRDKPVRKRKYKAQAEVISFQ
ncbi:MAG: hypothetical protein IKX20_00290 [Paludibacteraceae bacterium]|nr:hypothetical protein [Paludibacteraceae bacterium]